MAKRRFLTLDVFTIVRFCGNPLAVVFDAEGFTAAQMQAIAVEFNLSETVFLSPPADAANTARARIFTPTRELAFAGHPTLGAAVALAGDRVPTTVRIEERIGVVPVALTDDDGAVHAWLTAPRTPRQIPVSLSNPTLASAFFLDDAEIGYADAAPMLVDAGNVFLYVPLRDRRALARARCPYSIKECVPGVDVLSAYLYCPGVEPGVDFHARMFAPDNGMNEDPATGNAAAGLPGVLHAATPLADGRHAWTVRQGEDMGRRSVLNIEADIADGAIAAVRIGGGAVVVMSGEIEVD